MPDAAARFKMPGKAFMLCCVSHPANAMYFNASAASDAENTVVAPYSRAVFSSSLKSSTPAPEIAATSDMEVSKLMPTSNAALAAFFRAEIPACRALEARFAMKPASAVCDMVRLSLNSPMLSAALSMFLSKLAVEPAASSDELPRFLIVFAASSADFS